MFTLVQMSQQEGVATISHCCFTCGAFEPKLPAEAPGHGAQDSSPPSSKRDEFVFTSRLWQQWT